MSAYHITHERLKRPTSLDNINGTVGNTISIHHRIQVIDGRVRSPISGKFKALADVIVITGLENTHNFPSVNGHALGSGILHVLVPSIDRAASHATDWHASIDAL